MPKVSGSSDNQILSPGISLQFDIVRQVNFAVAQNNINIIKEISVENQTDNPLHEVEIRFQTLPEVIRDKLWKIDRIEPRSKYRVPDTKVTFNHDLLKNLNEAETGEIELRMNAPGYEQIVERSEIRLLAHNQWGGLGEVDEVLAAFVLPDDDSVDRVLRKAALLLEEENYDGSLNGYQRKNPRDVLLLVSAIWSALTTLRLTNLQSQESFESKGQKIRSPAEIVDKKLATKLDISLFLAATFEKAGLNPVVLFSQGHAWTGVWITKKNFGSITEPDVVVVRKAVQSREFIPIETELLTKRPPISFKQATKEGEFRFDEEFDPDFLKVVDIASCRAVGIYPLSSRSKVDEEKEGDGIEGNPPPIVDISGIRLPDDEVIEEKPKTPEDRISRWQRKLLDLTLRNRLLNFRQTKQTLQFRCPIRCFSVKDVVDKLKGGKKFSGCSLVDNDLIRPRDLTFAEKKEIEEEFIRTAFEQNQLVVDLPGNDMKDRFTNIYRLANRDMQEGGTNTLFLAAGYLRWKKNEDDSRIYEAPIVLIPVRLNRGSIISPFSISTHEDDIRINLTLLEFLKHDFSLSIPELENELDRNDDEKEMDFCQVFEIMRQKVRNITGFEVVEKLALSTFSFSKHLMWKDLVDRSDQLRNNRLVEHLLDGTSVTNGNVMPEFERLDLDRNYHPKDLFTPLPADSSQLAAIVAAAEGVDFIIEGPPGTGKSQTIANIICNCLGSGKTVLFVSEKMAALNVVHRRLLAAGFDDMVLELHSHKTDRRSVIDQLTRGWDRSSSHRGKEWIRITGSLKVTRDQLNDYVDALHSKGTQGFSVFDAISVVTAEDFNFALSFPSKDVHDEKSYDYLVALAIELGEIYGEVGKDLQFDLIRNNEWSYQWQESIRKSAYSLRMALTDLLQTQETLSRELGLVLDTDLEVERRKKLKALEPRTSDSALDISSLLQISTNRLNSLKETFTSDFEELSSFSAATQAHYQIDEVRRMPLEQLDTDWREAQVKMWPLSIWAKRKVRKLIQTYAKNGASDPDIDLKALFKIREFDKKIQSNPLKQVAEINGQINIDSLTESVRQAIELQAVTERLNSEIEDKNRFSAAISELASALDKTTLEKLKAYITSERNVEENVLEFKALKGRIPKKHTIAKAISELKVIENEYLRLKDWAKWVEIARKSKNTGLQPLVEALESGEIEWENTEKAFRFAYAQWWLPLAIDASAQLRKFAGWERQKLIETFRSLDERVMSMAQFEVRRRAVHNLPTSDGLINDPELRVLKRQKSLKRPSMPVRQLLGKLPTTFSKLAPCFLMSPLSVAQYLPADKRLAFDVVIFDEASQMTTWDAIGAIARGQQTIIAGDPKQLPPTNFFARIDSEDGDYPEMEGDLPSILDEAEHAGVPRKSLNWHYRSQDESLIAFSNYRYYQNKLVTFPAPSTNAFGIKLHKIKGTYARGAGRFNQKEAKAVVNMVKQRLTEWLQLPENERPTIGVITFNLQQQNLILDLLDGFRRNNKQFEWFFSDQQEEPVIVKNLENIQGDERDVILFSITFGPGEDGRIAMNFGAINPSGGERRLNVAITRARQEFHVFSSIQSDQIDLTRTNSTGVRHLRDFLHYAEHGSVTTRSHDYDSLGPAENIFEEAVANALQNKGWEVRTQIGESGFRIDLGVVHPKIAGKFLVGIECDGATYHSSATARDRDRIRQSVLEGLGWTILRVWSTDWFHDHNQIVTKLDGELNQILEEDLRILGETEEIKEDHHHQGENSNEPDGLVSRPDDFFNPEYTTVLSQQIEFIVDQEWPIALPHLARKVAQKYGWKRTGRRIQQRVKKCLQRVERHPEDHIDFVWPVGKYSKRVPFRGMDNRSVREVSRSEIASVIDDNAQELKISKRFVKDLSHLLGIKRLSNDALAYLSDCKDWWDYNNYNQEEEIDWDIVWFDTNNPLHSIESNETEASDEFLSECEEYQEDSDYSQEENANCFEELVRHKTFGIGKVIDTESNGDDTYLTVDFENFGIKTMMPEFLTIVK